MAHISGVSPLTSFTEPQYALWMVLTLRRRCSASHSGCPCSCCVLLTPWSRSRNTAGSARWQTPAGPTQQKTRTDNVSKETKLQHSYEHFEMEHYILLQGLTLRSFRRFFFWNTAFFSNKTRALYCYIKLLLSEHEALWLLRLGAYWDWF